jgi:hypothetical protein
MRVPTNHGATTRRVRTAALVTAPFAAGASATVIAFLLLKNSFPDRVATHFTLDGTADGFSSPTAALGLYMLMFAAEAVGIAAAGLSAKSVMATPRSLCTFACGLSGATTYLLVVTMRASSDTNGRSMQLPVYQLAAALAVGAAVAGAAWLISRRRT